MIKTEIEIILNGKKEKITEGITLRELLESKGINPNVVACELNMKIIKRAHLADTPLHLGDALEVIQMVGGG